ncbi:MAG: SRPBCC family protein [Panacagrimonas sp.]
MSAAKNTPMRVLVGLLIAFAVLVAGVVVGGFFLPSQAVVTRSIVIDRPASTVFTVLNGFRHFGKWSPWADLDPAMTASVEGALTGAGARYEWSSQLDGVGSGVLEIVKSTPYEQVVLTQTFGGTESRARFDITPEIDGTRVVWHYEADFAKGIFDRYLGLMLDGMIGPDYEKGLARLKAHVETLSATDFSGLQVEHLDAPAQTIAYLSGRSSTQAQDIARAYADAFLQITVVLQAAGIKPSGPVLAIGRKWDPDRRIYEFDAAIPVPAGTNTLPNSSGVKLGKTYAGSVLKAVHRDPHNWIDAHLEKLMAYKRATGLIDNGTPWDVYVSDLASTRDADLVTETYVPVR